MYAFKLHNTQDYVDLLKDTRKFMDDEGSVHAWMGGIAYDYWEQYLTIEDFMWTIGGWSSFAAFLISFMFLFIEISLSKLGKPMQRVISCSVGALLISAVVIASMLTVWGGTLLFGIQLSAFTAVCVLFATGFAVEYAVHVVHHFLEAQAEGVVERVEYAMGFLFMPTFMAFCSSAASVVVLAFSDFKFVTKFFFGPLFIVVVVTYFYGSFTLPALLGSLRCLPRPLPESNTEKMADVAQEDKKAPPEVKSAEESFDNPLSFPVSV